ncbi:MAG: hypothetical protein U0V75_15005 [Ferruginibacter sp.]
MQKIISVAMLLYAAQCAAQQNKVSSLIEGGKTIVELVKVFKTPRSNMSASLQPAAPVAPTDSCAVKNTSDMCFKNAMGKNLYITLVKRNGSVYETNMLSLKVPAKSQECVYELRTGIYKLKIETDGEGDKKIIFREGEIKINACENTIKEIKQE